MFGKLMSISDALMWSWYELLTDLPKAETDRLRARVAAGDLHPKRAKQDLGRRIVADFHSAEAASAAEREFDRRFSAGALPSELGERAVALPPEGAKLSAVMVEVGFAESNGAATRLIQQGSVRVDGGRIVDRSARLAPGTGPFVLQVGKRRVVRVVPRPPA